MGFELNRLMQQYGVSTPSMLRYSGAEKEGTAPTAPKEVRIPENPGKFTMAAPKAVKAPNVNSTPEQIAAYTKYMEDKTAFDAAKTKHAADTANYTKAISGYSTNYAQYQKDLEQYNKNLAKFDKYNKDYEKDIAAYNAYKTDYQTRLMNTPMYLQAQFQTMPPADDTMRTMSMSGVPVIPQTTTSAVSPTTATGMAGAQTDVGVASPVGTGITNLYQRYLQREPTASELEKFSSDFGEQISPQERGQFVTAIRPEMQERGMNLFGQQFYEDTGSYFGDQLRAPVYQPRDLFDAPGGTSTTASGRGPSGQSLEFRQGVRGYYAPAGTYAAPAPTGTGWNIPISTFTPGQPTQNPRGVPAGAIYDQSRGTYFVPYSHGGAVKGYARGGLEDLEQKYANPTDLPDIMTFPLPPQEPVQGTRLMDAAPPPPMVSAGMPGAAGGPSGSTPVRPAAPTGGGTTDLLSMIERYMPTTDYSEELKAARTKVAGKSEAFAKMLQDAMKEDTAPSREEMYWRLAAAFGSPTKTGAFSENLALAGKEMAEYRKAETETKRATRASKLQLGLKGAELDLAGAKEDLETLRQLQQEGMKDKRTIAAELVKQYVKSGEPESAAGKQAKDEGLKVGTPAFQARVAEIARSNLEAQTARIESLIAGMSVQQANLALAQGKFSLEKEKSERLSPGEIKLKSETEDLIGNADQALTMLRQAYKLNPNTFDTTLADVAQRKLLENTSSSDPKVKATRLMENLLAKDALAKLKASFGANPTEGERKVILELEGIGAKSKEERKEIMLSAFEALRNSRARYQKRLNEITQGLYRQTDTGGIE